MTYRDATRILLKAEMPQDIESLLALRELIFAVLVKVLETLIKVLVRDSDKISLIIRILDLIADLWLKALRIRPPGYEIITPPLESGGH